MNHRKFTRVNPHIPVDVVADGKTVSGEVRDISFEGLWLPTQVPLSERTPCRVTIHLAETIKISADGVVVRSESDGFAVQFMELLDLESYGHLRNLILYNTLDTATVEEEFDRHVRLLKANSSISLPE
jgi:hypothetical protein